MGLGVLGFSLDRWDKVEKLRKSYKDGIADAEPVGTFVNDNIMSCIAAYVAEDSNKALESYIKCRPNYLVSNVYRYHDTFPRPQHIPAWPEVLVHGGLGDMTAVRADRGVVLTEWGGASLGSGLTDVARLARAAGVPAGPLAALYAALAGRILTAEALETAVELL